MMAERAPLLGAPAPAARWRGAASRVACGALALCGAFAWVSRRGASASSSVLGESGLRATTTTSQWAPFEEAYVERWVSGDGSVGLEEHLVPYGFLSQTYAYWRWGLNGASAFSRERRGSSRGDDNRGANATTTFYPSASALRAAVEARTLSRGAVVFVDVRYAALDGDWGYEELVARHGLDPLSLDVGPRAGGHRVAGVDEARMDATCLYDHTPDLVRRSALLRALLGPARRRRFCSALAPPLRLVERRDED